MFPTILFVDAHTDEVLRCRDPAPVLSFLGRDLLIMAPKNFNSDSELPYVSTDA
jgi:hypothetical protein